MAKLIINNWAQASYLNPSNNATVSNNSFTLSYHLNPTASLQIIPKPYISYKPSSGAAVNHLVPEQYIDRVTQKLELPMSAMPVINSGVYSLTTFFVEPVNIPFTTTSNADVNWNWLVTSNGNSGVWVANQGIITSLLGGSVWQTDLSVQAHEGLIITGVKLEGIGYDGQRYNIPLGSITIAGNKKSATAIVLEGNPIVSNNWHTIEAVIDTEVAGAVEPVITTETITEPVSVPYNKVTEEDPTKPITFSAVTTAGVEGVETVTYEVTYTDGVETNRVEVSRVITTQPVTEVTTVGTMTDYVYMQKALMHGQIDFELNVYDSLGNKSNGGYLSYGTYRVELKTIGAKDTFTSANIGLTGTELTPMKNYLNTAEITVVIDGTTNNPLYVSADLTVPNISSGSATLNYTTLGASQYTVNKENGSTVASTDPILVKANTGYKVDRLEITYTYTDGLFPTTKSKTIAKAEPDDFIVFKYGQEITYKTTIIDMTIVVSKLDGLPPDPVDPVDPVDPNPEVTIKYIDKLERASSNMVSGTSKLSKTDTVVITANYGYVFQDEVRIIPSNLFEFVVISLHPDTSPEFNADRTVLTIPVSSFWTPLHDTAPPVSYEFIATASEKLQTEGLVTNFTKVYTVTVAELDKLSRDRFFNPLEGSDYVDYGEYIYSLYSVPLAVPDSIISLDKTDIQLGQYKATTASYTLLDRRILFNLGQIEVPEEYGNVYDYINTVCLIHVPYQEQPISVDHTYVIGESIGLMLALDLYSGEASLAITSSKINGGLVKRVDIPLTHDIPFMRTHKDTLRDKVGKLVYNDVTTPYIELIRNVPYETNSVFGKGSRDFVVLGSLSGYVEVEDSLVNTNATEAERNAISGLLKQGVYINDPLVP